jgi:hypothetical protein
VRTRTFIAALLLLVALLFTLGVVFPPRSLGDQSVAATAVPSSEFGIVGSAGRDGTSPRPPWDVRDARDVRRSIPVPNSTPALGSAPVPSLAPVPRLPAVHRASVAPVASTTGTLASWYADPRRTGLYAAVPAFRWGMTPFPVTACGPVGCLAVMAVDNGPHVAGRGVDLSPLAFVRVCGPLSLGICHVEVTR